MSKKEIRIEPIGTRVLIKPVVQEGRTSSGILLPETAKEKPQTGLILAVGEDEDIPGKVTIKFYFPNTPRLNSSLIVKISCFMEGSDILARIKP